MQHLELCFFSRALIWSCGLDHPSLALSFSFVENYPVSVSSCSFQAVRGLDFRLLLFLPGKASV